MIWALLAAYFLGGGLGGVSGSLLTSETLKQLGAQSLTIIASPERAKRAETIIADLRKETRAFERKFSKSGRQLNRSYKNHDADEAQTLAILDGMNSAWADMQLNAIELRFELREQMTEEEWTELFGQ